MDELKINGKKYISSKRAAELTGYAKDYIGQLARSGKVPGTRVGRAWYVEEEALLSGKASKGAAQQQEQEKTPSGAVERGTISPFQPRRPVISPSTLMAAGYIPALPGTWSSVVYSTDEATPAPVIPKSNNAAQQSHFSDETAVRIRVQQASPRSAASPIGIAQKSRQIRGRRGGNHAEALAFVALSAAMALFLLFSSGPFFSSHITLGSNWAYSANLAAGFQYLKDLLMQFPPFSAGVFGLESFFSTLTNSFSSFLHKGTEFILWLVSLV